MKEREYLLSLFGFLTLALLTLGALYSVASYLDRPVVHATWPTGECVRVIDPAAAREGRAAYSCDRLPDTYELVWVDGGKDGE